MQREARLRRLDQEQANDPDAEDSFSGSLLFWKEGVTRFHPTYKYRPGTGKFDLRGTQWDPDSKVRSALLCGKVCFPNSCWCFNLLVWVGTTQCNANHDG